MAAAEHHVTIKGVNDGLVFILNDRCDFKDLLEELRFKISTSHQHILSGPDTVVDVKLGKRVITEDQQQEIKEILQQKANLIVQSISSDLIDDQMSDKYDKIQVIRGMIRSGQTVMERGSLLYIGDINPGGTIMSTGDIFILGSLRGMAHAGFEGDEQAIIAASHLRPTQLRIADVISRPPDEWGVDEAFMEFAYLHNGLMEIDKINQLQRLRPDRHIL